MTEAEAVKRSGDGNSGSGSGGESSSEAERRSGDGNSDEAERRSGGESDGSGAVERRSGDGNSDEAEWRKRRGGERDSGAVEAEAERRSVVTEAVTETTVRRTRQRSGEAERKNAETEK